MSKSVKLIQQNDILFSANWRKWKLIIWITITICMYILNVCRYDKTWHHGGTVPHPVEAWVHPRPAVYWSLGCPKGSPQEDLPHTGGPPKVEG